MHFAPDTETTLAFIVTLGNTHPTASKSGSDELSTIAELYSLLEAETYSGRFTRDAAELAASAEGVSA